MHISQVEGSILRQPQRKMVLFWFHLIFLSICTKFTTQSEHDSATEQCQVQTELKVLLFLSGDVETTSDQLGVLEKGDSSQMTYFINLCER